jgi:TonB family protein
VESQPNRRHLTNTAVLYSFHDYVLCSRLAQGPGTELFAARHRAGGSRGEQFALKRVSPQLSADKRVVERLMQAVRSSNAIPHPRLCRIHEAGVAENLLFVATELVAGLGLDRVHASLQRRGSRMPIDLIVRVMREAASVLELAHGRDGQARPTVIHGNLTLSNILIGYDGGIKVSDFGLRAALSSAHGMQSPQRPLESHARAHEDVSALCRCALTLLGEHDSRAGLNSEQSASNALRSIALRVLDSSHAGRPGAASALRQALQELESTRAADLSTSGVGKWMRVEFSAAFRASEELQVQMRGSSLTPLALPIRAEQGGPVRRDSVMLAPRTERTASALRRAVMSRPVGRRWLLGGGAAGLAVLCVVLAQQREARLQREATAELAAEAAVSDPNAVSTPTRSSRTAPVVALATGADAEQVAHLRASDALPPAPSSAPPRADERRKARRRSIPRELAAQNATPPAAAPVALSMPSSGEEEALAPALSRPIAMLAAASTPEPTVAVTTPVLEAAPRVSAQDEARAVPSAAPPSSDFREASPLLQESPRFPARARRRGVRNGNVQVAFTIDHTGVVRDATVVRAIPPDIFDEAALEAVMHWRYVPRTKAGVPIDRHNVQVRLLFSEGR